MSPEVLDLLDELVNKVVIYGHQTDFAEMAALVVKTKKELADARSKTSP